MPTLLTRMSRPSLVATAVSTMRRQSSGLRHVGDHDDSLAAFRRDHLAGAFGPFRLHVHENDPRPVAGEQDRRRAALPMPSARNPPW